MTQPLDSRQLRAFSILARTGSFTETARQVHLSQSAISHAMKALEHDVGCRLLDRLGKSVALTQAGEQLLVHAQKILAEMDSARGELGRLGKWGTSRLRIGASTTACQHVLPEVLREFKESFPHCAISIEPGDTPPACGHSSPFDRQSSTVSPFLIAARCQEKLWQLAKERARQHVSNNERAM